MKLRQIIEQANKGYERAIPDSSLLQHCHDDGTPLSIEEYKDKKIGDSLGRFIVLELAENYDDEAIEEVQIETAIRCIESAMNDLNTVAEALNDLA